MKKVRLFIGFFIIFSVVFTCFYGGKKIHVEKIKNQPESYQGVLSLWQIDSFEGGKGSRKQFLLKVSRDFEKSNNGVLIMVVNMTKDGAEENFNNGIYPDIISFGGGVNVQNASAFDAENTVIGGMVGNKTLATAWCKGGYVLITNPNYKQVQDKSTLIVSQTDYTCPLISLMLKNLSIDEVEVLSPMNAYVKFVSGKSKYLLGTQRDINRLESRNMDVLTEPLTEFNDLFQYISICATDELKRYYAEKFINYLISENVQNQLKEIGMFSPFYKLEYENEHLASMQSNSKFSCISAFALGESIKDLQRLSLLAVKGDEQAKINIKNMLI